jgi:hypothetical protein
MRSKRGERQERIIFMRAMAIAKAWQSGAWMALNAWVRRE